MTDNEIIKALECCLKGTECQNCPMLRTSDCMKILYANALDLINRQKAEIERLKESRNRWRQLAEDFDRISREEEVGDEQ